MEKRIDKEGGLRVKVRFFMCDFCWGWGYRRFRNFCVLDCGEGFRSFDTEEKGVERAVMFRVLKG